MNALHQKQSKKGIATKVLFHVEKGTSLPTVVFFGGIHGNEKAGVIALNQVFKTLNNEDLVGNVYGVLGNLKALEHNQRYIDEDLNRLWTKDRIDLILSKVQLNTEEKELLQLYTLLQSIMDRHTGPLYFIDLHTTSSKSLPFITISDALINREFSKLFPVPIVLGIEEYLEGAMLSYINTLGFVSIGFESGQHTDIRSVENNIAFINLALVFAEVISEEALEVEKYLETLKAASKNSNQFLEIVHLHKIYANDTFKMKAGFDSFQPISKGTAIATYNNKEVVSKYNGQIFMPLYQKKGNEGFFIIRRILPFFLYLSRVLRRIKADMFLVALPGVYWHNRHKGVLKANLKVAKFLAKPIFHLFGYRSRQLTQDYVYLFNREHVAKKELYKYNKWFRKRGV